MYLKNNRTILILSSMLLLGACKADLAALLGNSNDAGTYPNVDQALWPYFKRFEQEADLRGFSVDLAEASITGFISDIKANHVLGQCSYNSLDPHRVTIDKPFWESASDLAKEFVVFHELGHCNLGRLHDESMDSRGVCLSIMRSGTGDCRDNYTMVTKAKYLDELFYGQDN